MKLLKVVLLLVATWLACSSQAMTVQKHGNLVFAAGPVEDDLRKFEEAFASGGVDTVVFVNSPGGDLWTGLRVGRLIADKGLKTVIAGSCISACSIMFMGGKERQFSDALRANLTMIGIHGAHDKDTKRINPAMQPQIYAFYKQHMGEKFNAEVMNQALYDMEDAGSLLRVFDPYRSSITWPYHCKSSQTPRDKCTKFEGKDALNLGIVTSSDLFKINLPNGLLPAVTLLGKTLPEASDDSLTALEQIAQSQCRTQSCKNNVTQQYLAFAENKALAAPTAGLGVGWSVNSDSPNMAFLRALNQCNHPPNSATRLCEVQFINQVPISNWYVQSDQAHKDALAALKTPTQNHYANEEFGGGMSRASDIRREKFNDMTPSRIDGVTTISTQQLASKLNSTDPSKLVLIDVIGFYESIPTAKSIVNAGFANADATRDEVIEKRLAAFLKVFAQDLSTPLVFFCNGRESWYSVNAALRAKKLGYTHIEWYRGGLEAWHQAQLPLAFNIARATAY